MLKVIAQNVVETFPLIVLQSVYAGIVHVKNKRLWNQKLKLSMSAYIPNFKRLGAFFLPTQNSRILENNMN